MRYEVHGFIPGRGFIARFYVASSPKDAIEQFRREHPKGLAFWSAPAPESQEPAMRGAGGARPWEPAVQLGLHTAEERVDALRMAERTYEEAIALLRRDKVRRATENLGYLQAIAALAYAEGEEDLGRRVERMLSDLGPRLNEAWRGV